MNHQTHPVLNRLLYLILFIFSATSTHAQKEREDFNIDSTLYYYYQKCQEQLRNPIILQMSDTLFQMAGKKNDLRMQAVALSSKLDYYYFHGIHEDSIIFETNNVKAFAKETHQPKYYYFAWGNRLIMHYLKTGRYNIALYESNKMLKEAQAEDSKIGLLYCYNNLSQVYEIKGFEQLAFEWRIKAIELTEKYQIENYNICYAYGQIADYYINRGEKEKALSTLKKAVESSNSVGQKVAAELRFVKYYLTFGEQKKAWQALQSLEALFKNDKRLEANKKSLYGTEYFYYFKTKQYAKALEAIDKRTTAEQELNEYALNNTQYYDKGNVYYDMGNAEKAALYYKRFIALNDSLRIDNEQRATSEFATLLNVEKLNSEKKELELEAQSKEIHNKTIIIISLIIILGIGGIFFYRENLLNRKLRVSEGQLRIKNEELTLSREELCKAKDRAEENSSMKSTFIQAMSHEIRTPLNSIVGFSQVLSDKYKDDKDSDTKEFAEIIRTNSKDLLRLITDVLILSELDQYEAIPADITTDINTCCQLGIESTKVFVKEGVSLKFNPAYDEFIVSSNPEQISRLLINLLHNAAKFTSKGEITLDYTVNKEKQEISFSVTDTGIGIPKGRQDSIFERFYKVDTFTQGTGLGLPICANIAEKMGGTLILDKTYKEGARFIFTIPYTDYQ